MTNDDSTVWVTIPDIAERFGIKISQVHRLIEERSLLARRIDGVLRVPEVFLGEHEPMKELKGTIVLLVDAGYSEEEALAWLIEPEDSLSSSPILALKAGRKAEVRRVAQALAF